MSSQKECLNKLCDQVIESFAEHKLICENIVIENCRLRPPNYYILAQENEVQEESQAADDVNSNDSDDLSLASFQEYLDLYSQMEDNPLPPSFRTNKTDTATDTTVNSAADSAGDTAGDTTATDATTDTATDTASDTAADTTADTDTDIIDIDWDDIKVPSTAPALKNAERFQKKYQELLNILITTYNNELDHESKLKEIAQMHDKFKTLLISPNVDDKLLLDKTEESKLKQLQDKLNEIYNRLLSITTGMKKLPSHHRRIKQLNKMLDKLVSMPVESSK